jgi:hypothetical protein
MRGACRHDQAAATPLATPVYLAPEPLTVVLMSTAGPLARATKAAVPIGFSRIDPDPPRTV